MQTVNKEIEFFLSGFENFWRRNPALLYGLAFLVGISIVYASNLLLIFFPMIFIFLPCLLQITLRRNALKKDNVLRIILAIIVFFAGIFYARATILDAKKISDGSVLYGEGVFSIDSISHKHSHFGQHWIYKGKFEFFKIQSENNIIKNVPATINIPDKEGFERPNADLMWFVKGALKQVNGHLYFDFKKESEWKGKETNIFPSLVERRYEAKKAVQKYIQNNYRSEVAASLLSGLAIGEFDDRQLTFQFSRFGVNHLLAISGFHFTLIAALLGIILRCFFNWKTTAITLIVLLTGYFIFLGFSPSIMRAWLAIIVALTATLLNKTGSGLNNLGLGLLVVLIWNPFWLLNMGFQFSFSCTAAILLFYQLIDRLLEKMFYTRELKNAVKMSSSDQYAYIVGIYLRQALSLGCAVELIAMPLTLFYFGKYPLIGFFYNLFFPFGVSIAMILLFLGGIIHPFLPMIGSGIHGINEILIDFLLNLTYYFPPILDYKFYIKSITADYLIIYMTLLFTMGIYAQEREREFQLIPYF